MGTPKEAIVLPNGRTMLAHALGALRSVCGRVAVVGGKPEVAAPYGAIHVPDLRPGQGPLAGLEALLTSGLDDAYIVVGCDQPLLSPDILALLAAARVNTPVFFRTEGGTEHHPFPGYFPASLAPEITEALDRGERSVRRFLRNVSVAWRTISDDQAGALCGFNTPEHLAAAFPHWPNRRDFRQDVRAEPMRDERSHEMEERETFEMPEPPRKHTQFVTRYPKLGEAWSLIGEAGHEGPLDERMARLVKLGIAIGAQHQGATHSSARKALAMGISREEIEQVVALAAGTLGLPFVVAASTWVDDVLEDG